MTENSRYDEVHAPPGNVVNLIQADWIGVDWGTSNVRAFALRSDNKVIDENESNRGMGSLAPDDFEPVLLDLVEPWLTAEKVTPIFACGMVGARQGWQEAEYRSVPCQPVCDQGLTEVGTNDDRISVRILPGLSQQDPHDVMRGEETQLAGFIRFNPTYHGTICLPGTHSKWVSISDGVVTHFQTFMTGELFSLLSNQSILRHSVNAKELDAPAFLQAALKAVEEPENTMAQLFQIRASSLLRHVCPVTARSVLSGMLIGQEVGMASDYWQQNEVALIGATQISSLYADTLTALGVKVDTVDAKKATLSGLSFAANSHDAK